MRLTNFLRNIIPQHLLEKYRSRKRSITRQKIERQIKAGEQLTEKNLCHEFVKNGIKSGDEVLVHCAFSKLGAVENGPQTFISALQKVVGTSGTILMPSSPNPSYQLDYIRQLSCFDVDKDVSKMGFLSEVFRSSADVVRSMQPTEPICAWGQEAEYYITNHESDGTAYGKNSPFYKLSERKGKILYIGVTLDNAGTSLHVLEDAVSDFPFPIYFPEIFEVKVRKGGIEKFVKTKVHNPDQSKKRRCDELLPLFEKESIAVKSKIGKAETWIFDAEKMLEVMLEHYHSSGVTMYTPTGK